MNRGDSKCRDVLRDRYSFLVFGCPFRHLPRMETIPLVLFFFLPDPLQPCHRDTWSRYGLRVLNLCSVRGYGNSFVNIYMVIEAAHTCYTAEIHVRYATYSLPCELYVLPFSFFFDLKRTFSFFSFSLAERKEEGTEEKVLQSSRGSPVLTRGRCAYSSSFFSFTGSNSRGKRLGWE